MKAFKSYFGLSILVSCLFVNICKNGRCEPQVPTDIAKELQASKIIVNSDSYNLKKMVLARGGFPNSFSCTFRAVKLEESGDYLFTRKLINSMLSADIQFKNAFYRKSAQEVGKDSDTKELLDKYKTKVNSVGRTDLKIHVFDFEIKKVLESDFVNSLTAIEDALSRKSKDLQAKIDNAFTFFSKMDTSAKKDVKPEKKLESINTFLLSAKIFFFEHSGVLEPILAIKFYNANPGINVKNPMGGEFYYYDFSKITCK